MKKLMITIALLYAGLFAFPQRKMPQVRPNIIVFLVDDMGIMDTSLPFCKRIMPLNKRYHTPNMEQMAKEGMKFVNAYAQPVCTPTRVSFITGMNASRTHVTNWTSPQKNNNTDPEDDQFLPLNWNINGLSPDTATEHTVNATPFPQLLRDAGYYTIHIGKAHWGPMGSPGANPYNLGFMVNVAGHSAGHPQSYLSEQKYGNMPGKAQAQAVPDLEEYYNTNTFLTEALTLEAKKAIGVPIERKEPFYLNIAHYAVHVPIMADKRFVQKYYDAGLDSTEAKYASLIEGMDKSLGDIMDFLRAKKVDKNTIIIFMSDNGGLDAHLRGGKINTHNSPFRSGKGSVYEGGVHEPMIVKWPATVPANSVNNNPVIIDDFFPTILEIAGIKTSKKIQKLDGISLLPTLKNPAVKIDDRPLIFHYPNNWNATPDEAALGLNYYSAIRFGNWKLVYPLRTKKLELYDLSKDIGEEHNLDLSNPVETKKLAALLGNTLRERNAQMPIEKSTGKAVPYPDKTFIK
ncbi:sulfatase [Pedobacter miscanthi]|uniref:sulfatase n=1 Tax=Pedobacter miscanthi TaxID=2259170 RepID=UPI0029309A88|nr:sulfatase [Pedobacter miscanthi]